MPGFPLNTVDPYADHRLALNAVLEGRYPGADFWAATNGPEAFAAFLCRQRLHALWWQALAERNIELPSSVRDLMQHALRAQALVDLAQPHAMRRAGECLQQARIGHFVAKGAQLRHTLYDEAVLRPAVDIDLFVRPGDRQAAIEALKAAGARQSENPQTLSHETKLTLLGADIDLHWDLFRPGRARPGLLQWLFGHRQPFSGLQGLDATASLFVMLVHPAITKYLVSPTSMLIHQVDQVRLMRSGEVDYDELGAALEQFGMRTAAWASLYLLQRLGGFEAPQDLLAKLQPNAVQRAYLAAWIDRAWISRLWQRRGLVRAGFSLALQDRAVDAVRAYRARSRALEGA